MKKLLLLFALMAWSCQDNSVEPELKDDLIDNDYALYFDGIDDYVEIGNQNTLDITNDLTISLWFMTESCDRGALVANYDCVQPDNGYELITSEGGGIYFECASNDNRDGKSTHAIFNDGKWHHVAAIYTPNSNTRGTIIVDGVEQDGDYLGTPLSSIGTTPEYIFNIGRAHDQANYEGYINDVSIWNMALSQEEINALMQSSVHGSEEGLVGFWNFDQITGESILDQSNYSNHGVMNGGVHRVLVSDIEQENLLIKYPLEYAPGQNPRLSEISFDDKSRIEFFWNESEHLHQIVNYVTDHTVDTVVCIKTTTFKYEDGKPVSALIKSNNLFPHDTEENGSESLFNFSYNSDYELTGISDDTDWITFEKTSTGIRVINQDNEMTSVILDSSGNILSLWNGMLPCEKYGELIHEYENNISPFAHFSPEIRLFINFTGLVIFPSPGSGYYHGSGSQVIIPSLGLNNRITTISHPDEIGETNHQIDYIYFEGYPKQATIHTGSLRGITHFTYQFRYEAW